MPRRPKPPRVTSTRALAGLATGRATAVPSSLIIHMGGLAPTRPFAAPVTTATYTVPGTITHDGTADVAADLQAWIATVPDGSIIDFAISGATYRVDIGLVLNNRHNLVIQGHGTTTIKGNGTYSNRFSSIFVIANGSTHITLSGLELRGNQQFPPADGMSGVEVNGWYGWAPCSYLELDNCNVNHVPCDVFYVEGRNTDGAPASYIWVHDCTADYIGKNGISVVNATDVWFENNTLGDIGGAALDLEPNQTIEQNRRVWFRDNRIAKFGTHTGAYGWLVSDAQAVGCHAPVSDITVTGNVVDPGGYDGYDGRANGLTSRFTGDSTQHHSNIVFTGNSTTLQALNQNYASPVIYCNYVDGLTITGNAQPMDATSILVRADNCTNVISSPNP